MIRSVLLLGALSTSLWAVPEHPLEKERREHLMERALKGDVFTMITLGDRFQVEGELELAHKWYREAADRKAPLALWKLVGMARRLPFEEGALKLDPLFDELILLGEVRAHLQKGLLYVNPRSPLHDFALGANQLRLASGLGSSEAQLHLGKLYLGEWGHKADYLQAIDYLTRASRKGQGEAFRHLGMIYRYGLGCDIDLEQAWTYYGEGGRLKDGESLYTVALALYHGDDIQKDVPRSHRYFLEAAELKHPLADKMLKTLDFGDDLLAP